jgi:hypothetical protein
MQVVSRIACIVCRVLRRRALLLGISGDQTMHLLWRLQNGEGPAGLNPTSITLMIGTNDVLHLNVLDPVRSSLNFFIVSGVQLAMYTSRPVWYVCMCMHTRVCMCAAPPSIPLTMCPLALLAMVQDDEEHIIRSVVSKVQLCVRELQLQAPQGGCCHGLSYVWSTPTYQHLNLPPLRNVRPLCRFTTAHRQPRCSQHHHAWPTASPAREASARAQEAAGGSAGSHQSAAEGVCRTTGCRLSRWVTRPCGAIGTACIGP